ncbi:hypothetical protein MKMG_00004 [Methanogenium sp. MK-MG]|nr:hypothetical protein MKMG_00004 [Methanogenium sp. MK-MG]
MRMVPFTDESFTESVYTIRTILIFTALHFQVSAPAILDNHHSNTQKNAKFPKNRPTQKDGADLSHHKTCHASSAAHTPTASVK